MHLILFPVKLTRVLFENMNRNTASESIKQKLIFAGSEEGKLLALRQSFAEVSKILLNIDLTMFNILQFIPTFLSPYIF